MTSYALLKVLDTINPVLFFDMPKVRFRQHVIVFTALALAFCSAVFVSPLDSYGIVSAMFAFLCYAVATFPRSLWVQKGDETSPLRPKSRLSGNVTDAAIDYVDSSEDFALSAYISINSHDVTRWSSESAVGYADDQEYIDSLSSRHLRWIRKKFTTMVELEKKHREAAG